MISDLQGERLIDRLPGQTAVADEFAVMGLDDPEPMTVFCIVAKVPADPLGGFPAVLGARVVLHDQGIAEEVRHIVEIIH